MNKLTIFKVLIGVFIFNLQSLLYAAGDIKIINLEKTENQITTNVKATIEKITPELKVLYKTQNLTPEAALLVAQAAMKNCRDSGYQVSVAVVDRGGNIQVLLRDRLAGIKTLDLAVLKAQTALSFKDSTSSLTNGVVENKSLEGVKYLPGVIFLAGGVNITAAGSIIGSIGVAGAPDSKFDERCAIIGLKPIEGLLEFAE